jgi:all-trans-8'-apo-beta-carotenal 15,15'-oxygenase
MTRQGSNSGNYQLAPNLKTIEKEYGFRTCVVDGVIPKELHGTLYRNGPGVFERFGVKYGHWFSGQGTINAVRFEDGTAKSAVKVVKSKEHRQELDAQKALFADYAKTAPLPWYKKPFSLPKNAANTSVLYRAGKLYALEEGHLPTELDPDTLETGQESKLGITKMRAFSAHPAWVSDLRCGFNFGMVPGRVTKLQLFKLPEKGQCELLAEHRLPGICNIHDFVVTNTHMVFFICPVRIPKANLLKVLAGITPFAKAQKWMPELSTEIWCIPLNQPATKTVIKTDPFFVFHFANAHDLMNNEELVVDYIQFPDFGVHDVAYDVQENIDKQPFGGKLVRAHIDLKSSRVRHELLSEQASEFPITPPTFQGKASPYLFTAAMGVGGQRAAIQRFNFVIKEGNSSTFNSMEEFQFEEGCFSSEPIFVPKYGSDIEGYLLSLTYDAKNSKSYISILDAQDFEKGVLAKIYFEQNIPLGFHGRWVSHTK